MTLPWEWADTTTRPPLSCRRQIRRVSSGTARSAYAGGANGWNARGKNVPTSKSEPEDAPPALVAPREGQHQDVQRREGDGDLGADLDEEHRRLAVLEQHLVEEEHQPDHRAHRQRRRTGRRRRASGRRRTAWWRPCAPSGVGRPRALPSRARRTAAGRTPTATTPPRSRRARRRLDAGIPASAYCVPQVRLDRRGVHACVRRRSTTQNADPNTTTRRSARARGSTRASRPPSGT